MTKLFARLALATALTVSLPALAQASSPPLLAGVFQDHAVLQRDRPIAVWGTAPAKSGEVRITLGTSSTTVKPDKSGAWHAELPAMPAGGPYTLTAATKSGASEAVNDVLVGDVWLCSGQSNMEFGVGGVVNAGIEIANAKDPEMRLLKVAHDTAAAPLAEFKTAVSWQPVTPDSVRNFSAACYFMARDLRTTEKVPFGLINSSWGGTAINPWRSEASLAADPRAAEGLALLRMYHSDPAKGAAAFGTPWEAWWRGRTHDAPGQEPWQANAPGDWQTVPRFEYWESWGVPALAHYDGFVWYRTEVTLTAAQAAQPATLTLAIADDMDMSFVNGIPVGTNNDPSNPRAYRLAPDTLRAGVNRVTVAVLDTFAGGGLHGSEDQQTIRLGDGSVVPLPLASGWQYRITPGTGDPPHAPWEAIAGMAGIYNAMIAPLGRYGLRGAAWYQGETDANAPRYYAERLAGMMSGWRAQFDSPTLPFLIVQLPNWQARNAQPVENGFASIRDEERRAAAADAHAALVVTIDLGDVEDLHPKNKQGVGTRMARAARTLVYGATAAPSGPMAVKAVRAADGIHIAFKDVERGLLSYSGAPLGFELCGPDTGSCAFATARISGNEVIVASESASAVRVRYCWGGSPVCNISDASTIPASPFELAIE